MRFHALDGLRGIAALIVVFNHFYDTAPHLKSTSPWLFTYTPLYVLANGRLAVLLFFVLSGFVLALPLLKGAQPYGAYLLKRFCRIYLPFAAALALSAALYALCARPGVLPPGGVEGWDYPLSPPLALAHLLMAGIHPASVSLNPPLWSLVIEMRVSLFFPWLAAAVFRFGGAAVAVSVVIAYLTSKFAAYSGDFTTPFTAGTGLGALLLTAYYLPFFALGILLAQRREAVRRALACLSPWLQALGMLLLLGFSQAALSMSFILADAAYGLIAAYAVACCVSFPRLAAVLSGRAGTWLGRVSYSLYLAHVPILLAMVHGFHGALPLPVILAAAFICILATAEAMHRLVERPSVALGKRLTARFHSQ